MVQHFYHGMQACVQNDKEYSEPFPVTSGVKQGLVMEPTLFSTLFSAISTDAFQDCDAGFPIRYYFNGKLFNLMRLQAKCKVQTGVLDELLYAYDIAKKQNTRAMDRMSQACGNYDLTLREHIRTQETFIVDQIIKDFICVITISSP